MTYNPARRSPHIWICEFSRLGFALLTVMSFEACELPPNVFGTRGVNTIKRTRDAACNPRLTNRWTGVDGEKLAVFNYRLLTLIQSVDTHVVLIHPSLSTAPLRNES